ncbi:MAG: isoaspartyl peptidase/L-asparaginase [Alphaproteobacteria bacterium]|nr:isoaspartyl peptidase/L-asparaginase [Alphaproteobacteria bacterium]
MTQLKEGAWALIVHGGAKPDDPAEHEANRDGILEAIAAGRAVLEGGGDAVDAVVASIATMEALPVFNAGRGSAPNEAGGIEMCSGLMDGRNLAVGAVGAIRCVAHPVEVARSLLPEKEVLLVADGALEFARAKGHEAVPEGFLKADKPARAEAVHDTVGAVALDGGGNIAAGTSTGGLDGQKVGRIGDSPMPGLGYYADNHIGGVAFSGDGETIARLALASRVMARLEDGEAPEPAIAQVLARLPGTGGADADGGGICITKDGTLGWAHNSPIFAVAYMTHEMDTPKAFLRKDEEQK